MGLFFNHDLLDRPDHFFLSQDERGVGGEVELADHAIFNAIRSVAELIL